MTDTYTFTKTNEQGRICKVTATKKADGTFTFKWFRPGFTHAVDKVKTKVSCKKYYQLFYELYKEGYRVQ